MIPENKVAFYELINLLMSFYKQKSDNVAVRIEINGKFESLFLAEIKDPHKVMEFLLTWAKEGRI